MSRERVGDVGRAIADNRNRGPRVFRSAIAAAAVLAMGGTAGCERLGFGGGVAEVAANELRGAATEPEVKAFYERRQWRAAWSRNSEKALIEALETAIRHGLEPSSFVEIIKTAEGKAARDAELTLAALTYAKALAIGAVDPKEIQSIYTLERPKVDVAAGLDQALASGDLAAWIEALPPQDQEYRALSDAYLTYREQASAAVEAPIPVGPEIRRGGTDPRVPLIARRLVDGGYLQLPQGAQPGQVFTPQMSEALKSLQRDARIAADGIVRDATVEALNETSADRARQLAMNLERRRWLARNPPATRIDVNTAAAELVYYRDGAPAWTSRTVVGEPKNATPQLGSAFKQLVVNPPWNVPEGIAAEEIFPKGPEFMAENNMYVDETGRVVQRPGPRTALGLVKFDMQNPHAIYLHDTPAKAVFQSEQRHRSHGCVRVERAIEFARFLAAEHGQAEAFDAALASGQTKTVNLGAEVPVRLLYHTAHVDPSGRVIFADDPYRWDDRLGEALGLGPSRRRGGPPEMVALLGP